MTDAFQSLRDSLAWDNAHPVRYVMRRVRYHVSHPRRAYRQFVYWPARTFWERGRRGWSVSDTWGLDTYLSRVIAGGVERLRDDLHGYPGGLTPEKWEAILTEIAAGFRGWERHWELDDEDEAYRQVQKSIRLMGKWFGHLWD